MNVEIWFKRPVKYNTVKATEAMSFIVREGREMTDQKCLSQAQTTEQPRAYGLTEVKSNKSHENNNDKRTSKRSIVAATASNTV